MSAYKRVYDESMCFFKPVMFPGIDEMVKVVITNCEFCNHSGPAIMQTRIKEYVESQIALTDYHNDVDFIKKLKSLYLSSYLVEFKDNKWVYSQLDDNESGSVSDTRLSGISYKLIRSVQYNLPKEESGLRLTSKEQYLEYIESNKDDKRFKNLLIDYKYIDGFWYKYPGGIMSLGYECNVIENLVYLIDSI